MRTTPSRFAAIAVAAASLFAAGAAQGSAIYYTIDLRSAAAAASPTPFIAFEEAKLDSNSDGWYETVLRINLRDPGLSNPYQFAQFRVSYDRAPTGLSVNIGDSRTNNGGGGDGNTQTQDAEMQIGALMNDPANHSTLNLFGNDLAAALNLTQNRPPVLAFAPSAEDVFLTVGDRYFGWDNGAGVSGSETSADLFALDGQADSTGPVNYNIYAAFNRSIDGAYRIGSGVGQVTVCLSTDQSCFAVPAPGSLPLSLLALGGVFALTRRPDRKATR